MVQLLLFYGGVERDPAIEAWFAKADDPLRRIAWGWFDEMRRCGSDVRELLHDGHPTVCVKDAGFGYVNAFTAHVNVGFFYGAWLNDKAGLLQGTGKRMRHVKLRPGEEVDEVALKQLISDAYADIQVRLKSSI